eukprot:2745209-Amphidinium_carterae.1
MRKVVDKSAPAYQEIETQSPEAIHKHSIASSHCVPVEGCGSLARLMMMKNLTESMLTCGSSEADDASDALTVSANGTPRSRAASRAASRAGARQYTSTEYLCSQ